MYLTIRRYKVDPEVVDQVTDFAKNRVLPELMLIPGFKAYYNVLIGDSTIVAVSIYADKEGAEASNRLAREMVSEHLGDLVAQPADVSEGEVVICEVSESLAAAGFTCPPS